MKIKAENLGDINIGVPSTPNFLGPVSHLPGIDINGRRGSKIYYQCAGVTFNDDRSLAQQHYIDRAVSFTVFFLKHSVLKLYPLLISC